MLGSFPKTTSASVRDEDATIIESVYDDESYFEEIVESDEEMIEEIVEDSDEETGTFDDQSIAFDDGSSVALQSLDSDSKMNTIQDELNQSAAFEGTRKAMEEELERDKSRARQAGLEALRERRLEEEDESLAEEDEEDASDTEENDEERRKRHEAALLKQKEQDEDAHRRLTEEIKRVDVALSKKRDTLAYTKLQGPDHVEKRKKALAELRRQAARQELARNNDALKATRASRGASSVPSQRDSASVPYQRRDPPSPTGSDPGYVEHASVPGNVDSVDIYLRTPAPVSPMKFGGALTPATASKLDFGDVTSPYTRMETPENGSETIEEESVPQALMNNSEKEDETSIEAPEVKLDFGNVTTTPYSRGEIWENESEAIEEESVPQASIPNKEEEEETSIEALEATAKNVEAKPAINTEDVGNMTDQALGFQKKAVNETEELPSEQEANSITDTAQDDGSTRSSNTALQNGGETPISKLVPPKSTSSVLPKEADQASKSSSKENMASPEASSDVERTPITIPKKRFSVPKTADTSAMPTAFQTFVKPLTNSDTTNPPPPNDLLPSDWDGKYHAMDDLRQSNIPGLDNTRREQYLSPSDFQEYFKLRKEEFAKFPKWKRDKVKRSLGLF